MIPENEEPRDPSQDPEERAGALRPEEPDEGLRDRRDFLRCLGTITFLTAAVPKHGLVPGRRGADDGEPEPPECKPINSDSSCGFKNGNYGAFEDTYCTQQLAAGSTSYTDFDCGIRGGWLFGGAYEDHDCGQVQGASDNDCGKIRNIGGANSDKDCAASGSDNDCGKATGGIGSSWTDQDCNASGSDNSPCKYVDLSCFFDSADKPDPPDPPHCALDSAT